MVSLEDPEKGKLTFNKLDDANDTVFDTIFKHAFRYANPNLTIWGPLAPAHDAIHPRMVLTAAQLYMGGILLLGGLRRFRTLKGARRYVDAGISFLAGSALVVTAAREAALLAEPNTNPLYVEIRLARMYDRQTADANLTGSKFGWSALSSYWTGPRNFMPMHNEQYWRMLYAMESFDMQVDEFESSQLIEKYAELVMKINDKNGVNKGILTQRITDIVRSKTVPQDDYSQYPTSFNLIRADTKKMRSPVQTFAVWADNNPMAALQLVEQTDYIHYAFPRLNLEDENGKVILDENEPKKDGAKGEPSN